MALRRFLRVWCGVVLVNYPAGDVWSLLLPAEQPTEEIGGLGGDIIDHTAVEGGIHVASHRFGQLRLNEVDSGLGGGLSLLGGETGAL